jgi:hypothetical protein
MQKWNIAPIILFTIANSVKILHFSVQDFGRTSPTSVNFFAKSLLNSSSSQKACYHWISHHLLNTSLPINLFLSECQLFYFYGECLIYIIIYGHGLALCGLSLDVTGLLKTSLVTAQISNK